MRKSQNIRRKGFTLVELLIVLVVIGILSAMMMLSSTEATSSAKATAIVSNLRNIKTAALAFYADHPGSADNEMPSGKQVAAYLKDGNNASLDVGYNVEQATDNSWYAIYTIQGTATEQTKIKEKLKGRKDQVGLTDGATTGAYAGGGKVGMFIR